MSYFASIGVIAKRFSLPIPPESTPAPPPPTAEDGTAAVPENTITAIDVVANDTFAGAKGDLTVAIVDDSSVTSAGHSIEVNEDNDIDFDASAVSEDEEVSFTYKITDVNGESLPATVTVTVQNAVAPSEDLPFFGQYYGAGWPSRSNGEWEIRSQPFTWGFYAERSGTVEGFRWHWRQQNTGAEGPSAPASGYSSGDGGTYTIQIRTGDAATKQEAASSTLIAQRTNISPGNPTGSAGRFFEYDFTTTGDLVAGNFYVIKAINTHSTPATDYVSQNTVSYFGWSHNTNPPHFTEPGGGGIVGDILVASGGVRGNAVGGSIQRVLGYSPHMIENGANDYMLYPMPVTGVGGDLRYDRFGPCHCSLRYSDGVYTGWGKGSGEYPESRVNVTGTTQVRQRFRVTRSTRTVSGVFILGWVSNTTGNLLVRLESGPENNTHAAGNGTLMGDQVSVPASMFLNAGASPAWNQNNSGSDTGPLDLIHYVWVPFSSNQTLTRGLTYNLRLVPSGCSFYMAGGNRDDQSHIGDPYGPNGRNTSTWATWESTREVTWTCFEDSRGPQVSTDSGTTWGYWPFNHQQIPITFKCV